MTTISKFKWFWAWQDEKEEAWLHEMAKEGLHLQRMGLPGSYIFEVGEPRDDYYRMDFITDRKDYQNYLQLFKDAGWEHIEKWEAGNTSARRQKELPSLKYIPIKIRRHRSISGSSPS